MCRTLCGLPFPTWPNNDNRFIFPVLVHRWRRLSYIIPDNGAFMVSTNRRFCKQMLWNVSGPPLFFVPHSRSLTYEQELTVVVCHAEGCLPVDFARGGVSVASLRERGEMGDSVWQPETLRAVKEQDPCRKQANCFLNDLHVSRLQFANVGASQWDCLLFKMTGSSVFKCVYDSSFTRAGGQYSRTKNHWNERNVQCRSKT